ncbi:hypothetical protein [Syntrophotalea acetylenica]|uniref:VCBS repeat-containing protein n=1 Tax=Syntrophotalea acetylenica TaxID=29542 RepID=A0A1L3GGK7_SYNAC|nr:hypothetical protein [Syntrophotalea acetylenica]APG24808.1 hypothetical protein A7E75_07045 [Syntrophotalea acetylenica]APG42865.1 hypothetical protein A6070_00990 [Syntrophotalea acetylenica]
MRISVRLVAALICLLCVVPAFAASIPWPRIDRALSAWQGQKELLLVTATKSPFSTAAGQATLEQLLMHGFAVRTGDQVPSGGRGLVLELKDNDGGAMAFLRRAVDGAIIAFERHAPPAGEAPVEQPVAAPLSAARPVPAVVPSSAVPAASRPASSNLPGPLSLPGRPRSLAWLADAGEQGLDLAVLTDEGVQPYRLQQNLLHPWGPYVHGHPAWRALYLEAGDPDRDGDPELVAVWADDTRGIYAGTDSRPRAVVFEQAGRGLSASPGPRAFVRLQDKLGFVQYRGNHSLYQGPVVALDTSGKSWNAGQKAVAWAGGNLFETTPIGQQQALQWTADQQLRLVSRQDGAPLAGGSLLYDFGEFVGPRVAVPLETPEYRAGFGKEDMVRETWHSLPPRVVVDADGTAYTIRRERSTGLPLIGKPTGRDKLVAVRWSGDRFAVRELFAGIEAFILDFALVKQQGKVSAALLLLNQKADGSGEAYLQRVPLDN